MLGTNEVMELSGCSAMLLHRWAISGIVEPVVNNGPGRGRQRQFSTAQAVAIVYCAQLADMGFTPPGFAPMLTDGATDPVTTIVIPFDVAVVGLAQASDEVITTVTTSPFTNVEF